MRPRRSDHTPPRLPADAGRDTTTDDAFERRILRPVALPTGRAIAGGLLVAVSVLGIFAAHRAATTVERTEWLVVRRPLAAGRTISADDLALAPMDLTPTTRRRAMARPGDAIGRTALVPLEIGDLLLRSTTAAAPGDVAGAGRRLALALDRADALDGDIEAGDRVDVVAVAGRGVGAAAGPGTEAASAVIVRDAIVGSVGDEREAAVGADPALRITLVVPDEDSARRVIDAHAHDGVSLIAATPITPGGGR